MKRSLDVLWQPFSFRNAPAADRHTTYPRAFALSALRPSDPLSVQDQYDYPTIGPVITHRPKTASLLQALNTLQV
ncbi:MAG: hypothetical protein ACPF8W_06490 [Luminiphilus sp.]